MEASHVRPLQKNNNKKNLEEKEVILVKVNKVLRTLLTKRQTRCGNIGYSVGEFKAS